MNCWQRWCECYATTVTGVEAIVENYYRRPEEASKVWVENKSEVIMSAITTMSSPKWFNNDAPAVRVQSCFCFSLFPVFWKVNYSLTVLSVKYQLPEVSTRQSQFQTSPWRRHSLTSKNTEGLEKHQLWARSHTADCTMLKHFDLFSHASTLLKMRGLVFSLL